jgi:alpha-galactosidase/6-phospho-beta-glucosidase family protein
MAHINTENKVDALILSRRATKTKIHKTLQPKEALHEFRYYIVQKRLGIRRNTDVQRNA